jgi:thiamine pyrophosphate-dependent acetolactate synthase large subunit-like protein
MHWQDKMKEERKKENPLNLKIGQYIVRKIAREIPIGQYLFCIDAGFCGSFVNAQWLAKEHRRFIVSVSANQPKWLFGSFLHNGKFL